MYKYEVTLKQHTPLIHFQHDSEGATLRATEVKPKLDRFIIELKRGKDNVPPDWWIAFDNKLKKPIHDSLNYKMRIDAVGEPKYSNAIRDGLDKLKRDEKRNQNKGWPYCQAIIDKVDCVLNDEKYAKKIHRNGDRIGKSYFGNMTSSKGVAKVVETVEQFKETVFYSEGVKLTIICFIQELMNEVKQCIELFFLLHNFGTRQSKGFGSFSIVGTNRDSMGNNIDQMIAEYYHEYQPGLTAYELKFSKSKESLTELDPLEMIRITYGFMKSGFNFTKIKKNGALISPNDYFKGFALQYGYTQSPIYVNDKAFVKRKLLGAEYNQIQHNGHEYRFTRAMLGISDNVKWKCKDNGARWDNGEPTITYKHAVTDKETDKEKEDGLQIKRVPSPILFSVVDERIFVLPHPIPQKLYDTEFTISSQQKSTPVCGYENIKTPTDVEFNLNKFLDEFCNAFNDKNKKWGGNIGIESAKYSDLQCAKRLKLEALSIIDEKSNDE